MNFTLPSLKIAPLPTAVYLNGKNNWSYQKKQTTVRLISPRMRRRLVPVYIILPMYPVWRREECQVPFVIWDSQKKALFKILGCFLSSLVLKMNKH